MHSLFRVALDLRNFKFSLDDDFIDRMNRQYSSGLLVLFAMLVSARQFFGETMHCWCPEVRSAKSACHTIVVVTCDIQ